MIIIIWEKLKRRKKQNNKAKFKSRVTKSVKVIFVCIIDSVKPKRRHIHKKKIQ